MRPIWPPPNDYRPYALRELGRNTEQLEAAEQAMADLRAAHQRERLAEQQVGRRPSNGSPTACCSSRRGCSSSSTLQQIEQERLDTLASLEGASRAAGPRRVYDEARRRFAESWHARSSSRTSGENARVLRLEDELAAQLAQLDGSMGAERVALPGPGDADKGRAGPCKHRSRASWTPGRWPTAAAARERLQLLLLGGIAAGDRRLAPWARLAQRRAGCCRQGCRGSDRAGPGRARQTAALVAESAGWRAGRGGAGAQGRCSVQQPAGFDFDVGFVQGAAPRASAPSWSRGWPAAS